MPPRSSISFCSGSRSITGYGVSGSISVEFAPSSPSDVARELGHGDVHAEADAEVRDLRARARRGRRGSCPPSRASRSRRARARRRRARAVAPPPRATCPRRRPSARARGSRGGRRRASAPRAPTGTRPGASRTCRRARSRPRSSRAAMRSVRSSHSPRSAVAGGEAELLADEPVEALGLQRATARGRRRARPGTRSPPRARRRRRARSSRGCRGDSSSCERQTTMSGWIPMRRSSLTECCVGFVFSSPAASMNGTSVTCR